MTQVLLVAVTPLLLKDFWHCEGEGEFYSPFRRLKTASIQSTYNTQTTGLVFARQEGTFASISSTHARRLLKVMSCLHEEFIMP